jgi:excinuclease ABC subunit B
MREAATDLDFEEAARLRDEIKRLRATELAVMDDPTAKLLPAPGRGASFPSPRLQGEGRGEGAAPRMQRGGQNASRIHKPGLDEMGIALSHEVQPHRPGGRGKGPRSSGGRGGTRGGWKPRGR